MNHALRSLITLCLLTSLIACSDEEKEASTEAAGPDVPALGVLELPISLRSGDPKPGDARKVEITPAGIRVDDKPIMTLESGKLPEAARSSEVIGELKSALASPAKSTLVLHVHSSTPYDTLARVLTTAKQAGFRDVAFAVRKAGTATETGWMTVKNFVITPRTRAEQTVKIGSVDPRQWDEFAKAWEAIYDACRGAQTGSCAYVQENVAKGGELKIELLAAGQGVNVNFYRAGIEGEELTEEEAKRKAELARKKEDFIQGRIAKTDLEKELLEGPPATEALFQFRAREALAAPSPITEMLKPLCGTKACGAIVSGEGNTLAVRTLSMIGAAFADGSASPHLAFEQPWTEKPALSKEEQLEQAAEQKTEDALRQAAAMEGEGEGEDQEE
ncbi:MAG: hypothetical protein PVI30_01315 [Myxococcales bacterium]|jgi:biopolymer transport protein ExbD